MVFKELKTCLTYHIILKQLKIIVCDIPNDEATEKVSVMSFKNDITNNFEATENKTSAPNTWLT